MNTVYTIRSGEVERVYITERCHSSAYPRRVEI
jgi:hypothetical protein